ncbi:MAG: polysaccharide export outer membrane protein [Paracoccaceae bacterium]|jgi:polysaccharide export outer membrane protein
MNFDHPMKVVILSLVMLLALVGVTHAQTPAQLAKFKQLGRSEQESIARAAGISLPSATSGGGETRALAATIERGTEAEKLKSDAKAAIPKSTDSGLPYFGYDIFAGLPTSFTPIADLPVPADYVVGPGDVITVQLFGKENESHQLAVGRDGFINFPKLGPISVAGQSFVQVKNSLSSQIKRQMIGVEAAIGIADIRLMQIYVLGEAYQPGAYNIPSLATATQAIIAAGGVKTTGSLRRIKVYRQNKVMIQLDLYKLLVGGDTSHDVRLQSGDVVYIEPVDGRVTVSGSVVRPAVYEAIPNESLNTLLEYAGGVTEKANAETVRIERISNDGFSVSTVNASSKGEGLLFRVVAGDRVTVPIKNDGLLSGVMLVGAIVNPGYRHFVEGMRVSDLFAHPEAILAKNADRSMAILYREDWQKTDVQYIPLQDILSNLDHSANVVLGERDELVVLPGVYGEKILSGLEQGFVTTKLSVIENEIISTVEKKRSKIIESMVRRIRAAASAESVLKIVEVRGPVKFPGVYPLGTDQTLGQLITIAGGMGESAYKKKVDLARLEIGSAGELAVDNKEIDLTNKKSWLMKLSHRDKVTVFNNPDWRNHITVSLEGEVRFPGNYSFSRGETLSTLIARAGGLTEFAYPQGAILSREGLRKREDRELKRLRASLKEEIASLSLKESSALGGGLSVSPAEAMSAVDALGDVQALGRLVVDVPAAVAKSKIHDILLEEGDRLIVPYSSNTVTVIGEVQYASSHVYEDGLGYKEYLSRAGGLKARADKKRVYVIRANGSVVLPRNSWFGVEVQEGDTVVVPVDAQHTNKLTLFGTVTQILYQLGVAYDVTKD